MKPLQKIKQNWFESVKVYPRLATIWWEIHCSDRSMGHNYNVTLYSAECLDEVINPAAYRMGDICRWVTKSTFSTSTCMSPVFASPKSAVGMVAKCGKQKVKSFMHKLFGINNQQQEEFRWYDNERKGIYISLTQQCLFCTFSIHAKYYYDMVRD